MPGGGDDPTTMTLTLRAVSLNDRPLTQPITAHFDGQGGSVGRADHNTLALPDPERHISRVQAEIITSEGRYLIRNVGTANPIIVRGLPLVRGESAPLNDRDQVRIGGYLLEVIHDGSDDTEASTMVRKRAEVDAATPGVVRRSTAPITGGPASRSMPGASTGGSSGGFGDLGAPLSSSNPFADLLGDPIPLDAPAAPPLPRAAPSDATPAWASRRELPLPPAAAGVSTGSAAWAPATSPPPRALLPDDFDPFAPPPSRSEAPPSAAQPPGMFGDLMPTAAPESIDALFGLGDAGRDPLGDFMADIGRPPGSNDAAVVAGGRPVSTDPMALFGTAPAEPERAWTAPTPSDHVSDLRAAYEPPAVRSAPTPTPTPTPTSREAPAPRPEFVATPAPVSTALDPPAGFAPATREPSGNPADAQALWAAFCEGAGISPDLPIGATPALMRTAGALLNAAVDGTLQLMMVRATAKHELRAQVTVIQARNNNPLKFSPDARSALEQLLQPPLRGFLAGPAAMTDAMHDLLGHTIGTMAGTRAALEGVLDRFTPQQLEAKLAGRSMLDSVLPMNRKAKLWELYLQHYDAIRNDAQEDFHSLFGRAFLAAYEQQLDRLQGDAPGGTPGAT